MKAYIYCDGASKGNPGPSAIGIFASHKPLPPQNSQFKKTQNISEKPIFFISERIGHATNNIAEWTALVTALRQARILGIRDVEIFLDSQLVVNQMKGIYKVRDPKLQSFHKESIQLSKEFHSFQIHHIPRELNALADQLANEALQT